LNEETGILVNRAKTGDLAAFEELVLLYQSKVYGLCRQLTNHSEDAQDLAQEAFIRAFRAIGSFRGEADFGTWLHRVTVNIWLNQKRKLSSKQTVVSLDETYRDDEGGSPRHEVADDSADPQLALESKELQVLVRMALLDLSEEHRAVLVLREMEGYSYEEVAQMLDCTLGTVKSRLNRARNAIRRRIIEIAREQGE
jgi:RNA polymerase sigma-70 factor (ECF subfamily)